MGKVGDVLGYLVLPMQIYIKANIVHSLIGWLKSGSYQISRTLFTFEAWK